MRSQLNSRHEPSLQPGPPAHRHSGGRLKKSLRLAVSSACRQGGGSARGLHKVYGGEEPFRSPSGRACTARTAPVPWCCPGAPASLGGPPPQSRRRTPPARRAHPAWLGRGGAPQGGLYERVQAAAHGKDAAGMQHTPSQFVPHLDAGPVLSEHPQVGGARLGLRNGLRHTQRVTSGPSHRCQRAQRSPPRVAHASSQPSQPSLQHKERPPTSSGMAAMLSTHASAASG